MELPEVGPPDNKSQVGWPCASQHPVGQGSQKFWTSSDDSGFEELRALGLKLVPIVARGKNWANGAVFRDVARVAGFEVYARQIEKLFNPQSPVLEELLGSLIYIAQADDVVNSEEIDYLGRVAQIFGFDRFQFKRLLEFNVFGEDQCTSTQYHQMRSRVKR